jgi:hypothetical protein
VLLISWCRLVAIVSHCWMLASKRAIHITISEIIKLMLTIKLIMMLLMLLLIISQMKGKTWKDRRHSNAIKWTPFICKWCFKSLTTFFELNNLNQANQYSFPFLHLVFSIKLNSQMAKILFRRHDFSDAVPM